MKKYSLLLLLLFSKSLLAQNVLELKEVVIYQNKNIQSIINKIKANLIDNCFNQTKLYEIRQLTLLENDTIINKEENFNLKIKSFNNKFIADNFSSKSINNINKTHDIFKKFDENETPNHWISKFPIIKNLNIVNFDFFKHPTKYKYKALKDPLLTTIFFESDSLYQGSFTFENTSFLLTKITYKNIAEYSRGQTNSKNLKAKNVFESDWTYREESVSIYFTKVKNQIILLNLDILEIIKNFKYQKYNRKGDIESSGTYNFQTNIYIKKDEI